MSDTTVEKSDVEEIRQRADLIGEKAALIRDKAFSLRNIAKPEPEPGKVTEVGDFASEIKNRLGTIQSILNEASESLGRFAG